MLFMSMSLLRFPTPALRQGIEFASGCESRRLQWVCGKAQTPLLNLCILPSEKSFIFLGRFFWGLATQEVTGFSKSAMKFDGGWWENPMEGPLDLTTISSCTSRQFRRDEPDLRFKKPSTMQYAMYGRVLNGSDLRDATKEIHAPKGAVPWTSDWWRSSAVEAGLECVFGRRFTWKKDWKKHGGGMVKTLGDCGHALDGFFLGSQMRSGSLGDSLNTG